MCKAGVTTQISSCSGQFSELDMSTTMSWVRFFLWGFPGGSEGKVSACNAGDLGSMPGSGRPPGEGNGTPLQYSCLENPMDREAW